MSLFQNLGKALSISEKFDNFIETKVQTYLQKHLDKEYELSLSKEKPDMYINKSIRPNTTINSGTPDKRGLTVQNNIGIIIPFKTVMESNSKIVCSFTNFSIEVFFTNNGSSIWSLEVNKIGTTDYSKTTRVVGNPFKSTSSPAIYFNSDLKIYGYKKSISNGTVNNAMIYNFTDEGFTANQPNIINNSNFTLPFTPLQTLLDTSNDNVFFIDDSGEIKVFQSNKIYKYIKNYIDGTITSGVSDKRGLAVSNNVGIIIPAKTEMEIGSKIECTFTEFKIQIFFKNTTNLNWQLAVNKIMNNGSTTTQVIGNEFISQGQGSYPAIYFDSDQKIYGYKNSDFSGVPGVLGSFTEGGFNGFQPNIINKFSFTQPLTPMQTLLNDFDDNAFFIDNSGTIKFYKCNSFLRKQGDKYFERDEQDKGITIPVGTTWDLGTSSNSTEPLIHTFYRVFNTDNKDAAPNLTLVLYKNGSLVIYKDGVYIWDMFKNSTNTMESIFNGVNPSDCKLVFESNGNIVLYNKKTTPNTKVWESLPNVSKKVITTIRYVLKLDGLYFETDKSLIPYINSKGEYLNYLKYTALINANLLPNLSIPFEFPDNASFNIKDIPNNKLVYLNATQIRFTFLEDKEGSENVDELTMKAGTGYRFSIGSRNFIFLFNFNTQLCLYYITSTNMVELYSIGDKWDFLTSDATVTSNAKTIVVKRTSDNSQLKSLLDHNLNIRNSDKYDFSYRWDFHLNIGSPIYALVYYNYTYYDKGKPTRVTDTVHNRKEFTMP